MNAGRSDPPSKRKEKGKRGKEGPSLRKGGVAKTAHGGRKRGPANALLFPVGPKGQAIECDLQDNTTDFKKQKRNTRTIEKKPGPQTRIGGKKKGPLKIEKKK